MTRAMLAAICAVVLNVSSAATQAPAARKVDPATAAAAQRLLTVTGAVKLALNGMETMINQQRGLNPQVPGAFWDAFLAHARRDTTQLLDLLVPIYATHLTRDEIEQLIRFYESPIGKRLTAVQPKITQESMAAGQTWGEAMGRIVGDSIARASENVPPQ
ncbi:MAG: DUF2059 domain-containing protein [Gemmatimonadales bacterium]